MSWRRQNRPASTGSRNVARTSGQALGLVAIVLLVCLGATYAFWHHVRSEADRSRRALLETRADETLWNIEERLKRHEQLLRGAAGLVAASATLRRGEFGRYVDSLQLGERYPEIRAIGIAAVVEAARRDRHVGDVRASGVDGYRIVPAGERPVYAPALYVERAAAGAGPSVGSDLYANAVRREALARALDDAALSMSRMVRLQRAPDDPGTPGVDLFMPFFDGPPLEGTAGFQKRPTGWIFAEICIHDMMAGLLGKDLGDGSTGVSVRIHDSARASDESRLYPVAAPDAASAASPELSALRELGFGGNRWHVELVALPGFGAQLEDEHPPLLLIGALGSTFLLASLTWLLATAGIRAREAAAQMNRELVRSESQLRELNDQLEHRVAERTGDLERAAERLTLSVVISSTGLWDWNLSTQEVHYSTEWARQIGFEPGEIATTIDVWESRLHPADRERAMTALREHLAKPGTPWETEFRLRHRDGSYRTILARTQVYADASGNAVRVVGSHLDITERKRAEDSLLNLTRELRQVWRQLSAVEEADRRWLAGELHDSIGGALAALNLNLTIIRDRLPGEARPALEPRLNDSIGLLEETDETVRSLMAQLRPPVLDDYGVAKAVRWYMDQIAARADLKATFRLSGTDVRLPAEVEIALFRVAQGALTNVAKHAGARAVAVSIDYAPESLRMVIADDGQGFVVEATHADMGCPHWGLVTMRERAESIGGHCTIESAPGTGTRVTIVVPIQ